MANHRRVGIGWRRVLATLGVTLTVVASSVAEDGPKTKKPAQQKGGQLTEVIRTEEGDDVDGHAARPSRSNLPKSAPTLTAAKIDELVLKGLASTSTPPSTLTSDEEFIRRVYLDLIGRLPEPPAIREFIVTKARDKRSKVIYHLLTNPAFSDNWARYWRDVVSYRSPNENDRQVNYPLFEKWLAGQFAANKPWNEIVTEIITATGRNDENGATAFAMAEASSPVEMAGEVSRVFMGVQIQCAQCHDHPSDPWKRQQFHEFAAFFSGVKSRRVEKQEKGKPAVFMISSEGSTHYSMPDLKNPEKKISISPRFFLNEAPKVSEQVKAGERLKLVAGYITDPDNPWFPRAFINRVWASLMGEGFYNPVDDLGPTRTANSPEILEAIADDWVKGGYDIRWLFRTILNTETYQRASRSTNTAAGRIPFAANVPSRLRADQIFDALTHALDLQHEREGGPAKPTVAKPGEMMAPKNVAGRDNFLKTFGVDPSTPSDEVFGTIPQALFLMNSPLVTKEIQARPKSMLGYLLITHPDNRSILDILYLRALGRRPTDKEVRTCSNFLHGVGDRAEAFEDILWALLNSTEFLSRR
jgi:hypothetical protein